MEQTQAAPKTEDRIVCASRMLALDEEKRQVRHVISTGALDRMNRMVEVNGWKLSSFRDNPVVLADHEYAIERIIGTASDTKVEGNQLVSTTTFAEEGLGAVAFRLVQAGIVKAWSVGWQRIKAHYIGEIEDCERCKALAGKVKYGTHFTQQELLEYSLVAIPANRDAVMGLHSAGLVRSEDAELWLASITEQEGSEEQRDEEIESGPPSRSPEFYRSLFVASRSLARRAAALRVIQRARGIRP